RRVPSAVNRRDPPGEPGRGREYSFARAVAHEWSGSVQLFHQGGAPGDPGDFGIRWEDSGGSRLPHLSPSEQIYYFQYRATAENSDGENSLRDCRAVRKSKQRLDSGNDL